MNALLMQFIVKYTLRYF